jgi:hypothetical protein
MAVTGVTAISPRGWRINLLILNVNLTVTTVTAKNSTLSYFQKIFFLQARSSALRLPALSRRITRARDLDGAAARDRGAFASPAHIRGCKITL